MCSMKRHTGCHRYSQIDPVLECEPHLEQIHNKWFLLLFTFEYCSSSSNSLTSLRASTPSLLSPRKKSAVCSKELDHVRNSSWTGIYKIIMKMKLQAT